MTVRLTTNKETIPFTPERFREEYGFGAAVTDCLKALMGDSSDNISGVAGVGQKTASKWCRSGKRRDLYAHLEEAKLTKSVHTKLTVGQDAAKESKWLATIVTDVPIDTDVHDYVPQPVQTEEVRKLLLELEMAKLLDKLKLSGESAGCIGHSKSCTGREGKGSDRAAAHGGNFETLEGCTGAAAVLSV